MAFEISLIYQKYLKEKKVIQLFYLEINPHQIIIYYNENLNGNFLHHSQRAPPGLVGASLL